nr:rust resistance kinase Lr10-like [Ziziphus jujuba var. spinosa]
MGTGTVSSSPFISFIVLLVLIQHTSSAKNNNFKCSPSSCGNIPNIGHPFRLRTDPENCGDLRYNLSCEDNNTNTVLYLFSIKFYVQEINYDKHTIRLVDSNLHKGNSSSIPPYSLSAYNFSNYYSDLYVTEVCRYTNPCRLLSDPITFLKCEYPVNSSLYIPTNTPYINSTSDAFWSSSGSFESGGYSYVKIGSTYASELKDYCRLEQMLMTSKRGIAENRDISYIDIHNILEYGFELLWLPNQCYLNESNLILCEPRDSCDLWGLAPASYACNTLLVIIDIAEFCLGVAFLKAVSLLIITKIILGIPCVVAFLIYKWRKRHLSMYNVIEEFLQTNNGLMPIRYSYSDIRRMTKGFKNKLGEGGYGCVYKGKLRSGHLAAIKMLGKSKANGQDFINEVATIGRIHHINVVKLVGFCVEGSKRALVYDFMPNGSLDKYIFSHERNFLGCKKMCEISLGVARGIEYLHQGCNMQILHFDIKPHNILLDENFIPKVSDFGLARLCPLHDSIVSLTAARGTMGYIAPELFYKNIGPVSNKADVYSFGMLLMEMASRRKNLDAVAAHTSQIYFPSWVYDQFNEGNDLEMEDATEDESKIRKKMIIVALWCIQMKPSDRPSINRVKKMLEGEIESLKMPPKPSLCPENKPKNDNE